MDADYSINTENNRQSKGSIFVDFLPTGKYRFYVSLYFQNHVEIKDSIDFQIAYRSTVFNNEYRKISRLICNKQSLPIDSLLYYHSLSEGRIRNIELLHSLNDGVQFATITKDKILINAFSSKNVFYFLHFTQNLRNLNLFISEIAKAKNEYLFFTSIVEILHYLSATEKMQSGETIDRVKIISDIYNICKSKIIKSGPETPFNPYCNYIEIFLFSFKYNKNYEIQFYDKQYNNKVLSLEELNQLETLIKYK